MNPAIDWLKTLYRFISDSITLAVYDLTGWFIDPSISVFFSLACCGLFAAIAIALVSWAERRDEGRESPNF